VVDWAAVTAIGTVMAGLALPLAFFQLDAQRRERLRAQVSKVGAWTRIYGVFEDGERPVGRIVGPWEPGPEQWTVRGSIRNSSELPVVIHRVDLTVRGWGYDLVRTDGGGDLYGSKKFGHTRWTYMFLGQTIEPESTREESMDWHDAEGSFDRSQPPMVSIDLILVTDAAGHLWEIRPSKARPPRLVRWRRRKAIL
jgi:hypothetical protein